MNTQLLKLSLLNGSVSQKEAELLLLSVKLLLAIGSRLDNEEQETLSKYLQVLPEFFSTDDGAEVAKLIVSYLKEKPAKE